MNDGSRGESHPRALTDLYILGAGIRGGVQFTVESTQALQACRAVFVLHDDLMVHKQVARYCPNVVDLAPLYDGQSVRSDVYSSISRLLVEEARREPTIAFVVHGHPLFLVSATERTVEFARENGLNVRLLPAVSSFDAIMCDLETDLGYGVQIFDATTMIRQNWLPNSALPTLVFQIATVLEERVVRSLPAVATLAPLVEHLCLVYPAEHACTVIHSGSSLIEPAKRVDLRLADLTTTCSIDLWMRPTLYLPALPQPGLEPS